MVVATRCQSQRWKLDKAGFGRMKSIQINQEIEETRNVADMGSKYFQERWAVCLI